MRHRHKTKKLQRNKAQRRALLANQACSLIEEGEIRTTLAKAKALRPVAEKMVTLGKKGITAESSGETAKGVQLNHIMRHTVGLFHGQNGSRVWKQYLSKNMCIRDADLQKVNHIMDQVKKTSPVSLER